MRRFHHLGYMLWGGLLPLFLATVPLSSCSHDEAVTDNSSMLLPERQYPLQLQIEIEPQSRIATKDAWTGDGTEYIAVRMADGETGKYVITADQSAQPATDADAFYWPTGDMYTVTAWYPYQTEQKTFDLSDQSAGNAELDFLYAKTQGHFNSTTKLRFKHQLARLEIKLADTDNVFSADELQNATITIYGEGKATRNADGTLEAATIHTDKITPYHNVEENTWEAFVLPQDMRNKTLLRIKVGGKILVYTPDTYEMGILTAGNVHAYTISLNTQASTSGTMTVANNGYKVYPIDVQQ